MPDIRWKPEVNERSGYMDIVGSMCDIRLEEISLKKGEELKIKIIWGCEREYDVVCESTEITIKIPSVDEPQININGKAKIIRKK